MAEGDIVQEPLKATVFFERKVQVRDYESAVAGIHIQADVPLGATQDQLQKSIEDAFFQAKAVVFEQLGIEFKITDGGVVMETIQKHFGPVEVVEEGGRPVAAAPAQRSTSSAQSRPANSGASSNGKVDYDCSECGRVTPHWDNRPKKASGEYKAKSPDLKCATKDCGKGVWLKKGEVV